jgi:hypothetical protein
LTSLLAWRSVSAVAGSTVMPRPEATMLRSVSSELPCRPGGGARENSVQVPST